MLASGCEGEDTATEAQTQQQTATAPGKLGLSFDRAAAASDPFKDPSGPFFQQVLKATSPDGVTFTKVPGVVIDKASVPDIIRMPDGRLIIYAVDGANRSKSGLMLAISDDNGETWQQGSLQVKYKGDHGPGVDPDAVVLDDGSVRLFYIVFPKEKPPLDAQGNPVPGAGEPIRVMSALSEDGITFEEEEGDRLVADEGEFMTDPDVVEIGGIWFMYVSKGQTDVAFRSDDGMSYTRVGPISDTGAVSNTVSIGGKLFRQYYCGQGIQSAVTGDGLNFEDDPGIRLQGEPGRIACDPAPVQVDGKWLMFYKTGNAPQPGPQPVP